MARISDNRTEVIEVDLVKESYTDGDRYKLMYKTKGNSAWKGGPTTANMQPDSLNIDGDEVNCKEINGTKRTFYISSNNLTTDCSRGYESCDDEDDNKKKDDKSNNNDNDSEEGYCAKFLLTIILVLPLWWVIKLPFKALLYYAGGCCCGMDSALPKYSLKKF